MITHYYLADALGSTMAVVDSAGAVVNTYDYDVFGGVRASTGTQANVFKFTGEQADATTGLEYLRARYYDVATGRFVNRDPLSKQGVWEEHPFVYASSNPVLFTDPSGLDDDFDGDDGAVGYSPTDEQPCFDGFLDCITQAPQLAKLRNGVPVAVINLICGDFMRMCQQAYSDSCSQNW